MKKLIALATAIAFLAGIAGCDDTSKTQPSTDTRGSNAQPVEGPSPPTLPKK